jgi:hypothetical protein
MEHLRVFDPATRNAPGLCQSLSLQRQRAQETPGARCTRSRAWSVESTRVSHHRFTGNTRHFLRNGFTVSFALSPATGLVCHRHPQETCKKFASQELDASVGASGPHDFAVHRSALRPRKMFAPRCLRPPHPLPYVRDDRETPLCVGRDGDGCRSDLGQKGIGIFFDSGLDSDLLFCPTGRPATI